MFLNKSKFKKIMIIVLLTFIFINFIPIKSFAHNAYFFQVLIDDNTMSYIGNVLPSKGGAWGRNHIETQLWKSDKFIKTVKEEGEISINFDGGSEDEDGKFITDLNKYKRSAGLTSSKEKSKAFTFPSKEIKTTRWPFTIANNATVKDVDRVFEIRDALIPNLNEILIIINDEEKFDSLKELIEASIAIANGNSYNGWSINYSGNDITVSKETESYTYLARMVKGYSLDILEDGRESKVYNSGKNFDFSDDVDYISIPMIIAQGLYSYDVYNHLADDMAEHAKPSLLEKKISEFLASGITGIKSTLGLYNLDELIYNQGLRDPRSFYGGVMSNEWMRKTTTFHMIFQAIAWLILALAVLKILIQRNFATVYMNPAVRLTLMDGLKDMLLTGFILISSFVLLNVFLKLNEKIVGIFSTTIPNYAGITGIGGDFQTFSGNLLQIYYLIITIYMNFIYIIRGITVAILIASAPLFIVSIAFENKNKRIFTAWMKELIANIFLQSFHAFTLSFLLNIQLSTRGIELAVISLSLIPLTNLFKSLIVGQSGGLAGQLGMQATTTGLSAAGSLVGSFVGSKRGGESAVTSNRDNKQKFSDGNIKTKDSSSIPGARENPERKEHSITVPTKKETREALNAMETDYDGEIQAKSAEKTEDSNYEKLSKKSNMEGSITRDNVKNTLKGIGSTAFTVASGAGKAVVGASIVAATGGESHEGAELMSSGMSDIGYGSKRAVFGIASGTKKIGKRAIDALKTNKGGNILGAERMDNGNIAIHRDKEMLRNDGLKDVRKTSEGNIAMTLERDNLNRSNKRNLAKIENLYKDKKNHELLKQLGIEKFTKNQDGDSVVHFNQYGQNNLGFIDMYNAGDNRIVEVKNPTQPLDTSLLYDIDNIKPNAPTSIDNYKQKPKTSTIDLDNRA